MRNVNSIEDVLAFSIGVLILNSVAIFLETLSFAQLAQLLGTVASCGLIGAGVYGIVEHDRQQGKRSL